MFTTVKLLALNLLIINLVYQYHSIAPKICGSNSILDINSCTVQKHSLFSTIERLY